MTVKRTPEGYHAMTPYLIVNGAADAIEFYKRASNATEIMRLDGPDGSTMHAEIQIGDSRVMIADENPAMGARRTRHPRPAPTGFIRSAALPNTR